MHIRNMTQESLILLEHEASTRAQVLDHLADQLEKAGYISNKQQYLQDVFTREEESPTGFEQGIAIPHGRSSAVIKSGFAFMRTKKVIKDWPSLDEENQVQLIFLLAIPQEGKSNEQMKLLATLSTALLNQNFIDDLIHGTTPKEILHALDKIDIQDKHRTQSSATISQKKRVLAITACATGIAHTYMAAEALVKAGKALDIDILVEKQGANGLEDKHTQTLIAQADALIIACDIAPKEIERFVGLPYISVKVAQPLKHAEELITRVLTNPDGRVETTAMENDTDQNKKHSLLSEMMQAIMTGISYMIPVIVAAGLMMGLAKLTAMAMGQIDNMGQFLQSENAFYLLLGNLDRFGGLIFRFIYPIFGAYAAYSLADRQGIVPGFIGGSFAAGLHFSLWGISGVASGFLGAMFLGLLAGYVARFLNQHIKLSKNLVAMKPMFLIPGISVLIIFIANFYFVDPVFGALNSWMEKSIRAFDTGSELMLVAIIAAATAFDLGGPINKAAGAIAIGLAADAIFPLTGRVLAIVIPPIGLGLSTVIDKYLVGRHVYSEELRIVGSSSIILGFIAISEGAIPFMLKNPLITIPLNILGAIIGATTAVALGAVQWNPLPAIWGWPLVENLWAYLVGLLAGVLFIAISNVFVRFYLLKKFKKNQL
ncbi:fructose-specific PTS transporter subunit EIIC [Entomospira culicis]|uniref:protein-N(pi)-phosphohistidine--D-fructose phosphotransferase n=1 Tax=Entomospira culicis TaxID=2719989 RepID=A0A968GF62_9SPIO|nr:fructose-specific PTS transporter subunit EIIC [Entomospira culicis]NIZ19164.1 PTS transporter subunit EIIA [Entomospira culicis]NIZ69378.1 PTS transporter subunit EIIA [Entomospira culicis]WDI36495.1 fructose-specific PTS transporter subunit EIIC [Entomospira culicis]WDI38121.1 fructose-specific PTS transporter subunit EIIC [Entomospira culicis]